MLGYRWSPEHVDAPTPVQAPVDARQFLLPNSIFEDVLARDGTLHFLSPAHVDVDVYPQPGYLIRWQPLPQR